MVKRLYNALPGPTGVRIALVVVLVVVALIALAFLFERAGDFIDNGGVIR